MSEYSVTVTAFSSRRPMVLIVEDAATCASILEILVNSIRGVTAVTASNGEEAWQVLENESEPVRAIVTDLHMAGMDGFELMARVRSHKVHSGAPIIVVTGCTDPDVEEKTLRNGADAVFLKPYSPTRLREKLEQLLSHENPRD